MMKVKDKWFRIIAIVCIFLVAVYSNKLYSQPLNLLFIERIVLILASITLVWEGNRFIILHFRERFHEPYKLVKRIAFVFITGMLFTSVLLLCTAFVSYVFTYGSQTASEQVSNGQLFLNFINNSLSKAALVFTLFFGIYEAFYYYTRLKQSEEEKNRLEKEKLWSQLENLNQQVNPHFLFNTLNTLSSLISEDPAEADKFLNEMTKVYRYLLENNKHELVTLQTETKFIQSFYQLLKLRHGKGVELIMQISPQYEDYLLPPLTLQLLVENAVKHNVTSKSQPLKIEISATGDKTLTVKNNLQKKKINPVSTNIGLNNITARYRLIQKEDVVTKEEGNYFIVALPLIHPAIAKIM